MNVGAFARRVAMTQAGRLAVALLTVTGGGVLALLLAQPAQATPYPPTPPCLLSWAQSSQQSVTVTGSGLGRSQAVRVTLYPQSTRIGSWVTDPHGSFQARVALPNADGATEWLAATTRSTSCTSPPPGSGAPGSGTSSGPSGGSSPTAGTTGPSSSIDGTAVGGGGVGGGGAGISGQGGPTGTPTAPASGAPSTGSSTPRTSAPTSSGATPTPTPTPSVTPGPPLAGPVADLGLPASLVISIAALLLLAGGGAVIFLTRRAG